MLIFSSMSLILKGKTDYRQPESSQKFSFHQLCMLLWQMLKKGRCYKCHTSCHTPFCTLTYAFHLCNEGRLFKYIFFVCIFLPFFSLLFSLMSCVFDIILTACLKPRTWEQQYLYHSTYVSRVKLRKLDDLLFICTKLGIIAHFAQKKIQEKIVGKAIMTRNS